MTHARATLAMSVGVLVLATGFPLGKARTQTPTPVRDPNRPVAVFVFDMANDGFQFTSADEGVTFDIDGTGKPIRIGWTKAGGDDGFLFLDTNGNGRVDSGRELLGNGWRKPDGSRVVSGDEALTVIQGVDHVPEGAVSPELAHVAYVDAKDEVFARLRIWCDANHNGQSELDELRTLPQVQIKDVYLGFRMPPRAADANGNITVLEGSFHLQPPPGSDAPAPGRTPPEIQFRRRMLEVEFARSRISTLPIGRSPDATRRAMGASGRDWPLPPSA
jgi:hypothetical protein